MSPSIQSKYWRIFKVDGGIFDYEEGRIIPALFWCLPSVAGKHGLLKETGVASTRARQSESQGRCWQRQGLKD